MKFWDSEDAEEESLDENKGHRTFIDCIRTMKEGETSQFFVPREFNEGVQYLNDEDKQQDLFYKIEVI